MTRRSRCCCTAPRRRAPARRPTQIDAAADKLAARLAGLPLDGVVVYDIQDETGRTESPRPFPFIGTVDPRDYATLLSAPGPPIVYKALGTMDEAQWRAWLDETRRTRSQFLSIVGRPASGVRYPLPLSRAIRIASRDRRRFIVGGVVIAERHDEQRSESARLLAKGIEGCGYFISQAVYHAAPTQRLLADYLRDCRGAGVAPKRIVLTFAPCGREKTLAFLRWLGVNIAPETERAILGAANPLAKSIEICRDNLRRILDGGYAGQIPLGVNVESVSINRDEIDASVELFHALQRSAGRPMKRSLALLALAVLAAARARAAACCTGCSRWRTGCSTPSCSAQAAALAPDPDIVLVNIDEKSLGRDGAGSAGRLPWPRAVYADLIEGLAAQKPRAIVFDMMFSEPDRFRPQSDQAFVEAALRRHAQHLLPDAAPRLDATTRAACARRARAAARPDARGRTPIRTRASRWCRRWSCRRSCGASAPINFLADDDGVGRRYLLRERIGGWDMPSLPARVALRPRLSGAGRRRPGARLARRAPSGFPRVSFSDLYEDFERSRAQAAGRTSSPARSWSSAPPPPAWATCASRRSRSMQPGAEILGTAIENLKNGRAMRYAPPWWPAAIGIVLLAAAVPRLPARRRCARDRRRAGRGDARCWSRRASCWSGGWCCCRCSRRSPRPGRSMPRPALAEYLRARRGARRRRWRSSRASPIRTWSKQLVERGGIETGRRDVTLLFSDIRGFTTLSETRSPEEVVALLNRYFTLQVDVVFRHGGSLDKFIGDCIMAMWGAPLDQPDHARRAVACALDMADTLQAFKRELGAEQSDFDVGIGLHSGPAVVGLMGSREAPLSTPRSATP